MLCVSLSSASLLIGLKPVNRKDQWEKGIKMKETKRGQRGISLKSSLCFGVYRSADSLPACALLGKKKSSPPTPRTTGKTPDRMMQEKCKSTRTRKKW